MFVVERIATCFSPLRVQLIYAPPGMPKWEVTLKPPHYLHACTKKILDMEGLTLLYANQPTPDEEFIWIKG